jgi:hypothetical protein
LAGKQDEEVFESSSTPLLNVFIISNCLVEGIAVYSAV